MWNLIVICMLSVYLTSVTAPINATVHHKGTAAALQPIFFFNSNLFLHWALKIKYLSICHFSCSSITSFTLLFSMEILEILFWYVILFPTVAENMCTGTLQKSLLRFIIIIIQACLDMHTTNDIQGK